MNRRITATLLLLSTACGSPTVADRIDALLASGSPPAHAVLPSPARSAELDGGAAGPVRGTFSDELRARPDGAAILDAGREAVPALLRLLDDPARRRCAAVFLAEIGGPSAADGLLAQWRKHRGSVTQRVYVHAGDGEHRFVDQGYEPDDGGFYRELIFALCFTGREVSSEIARDTKAAMDEAERLLAEGKRLDRTERRGEGRDAVEVGGWIEPVETAAEGLHILGMAGAKEGPELFTRALRSSVEHLRWTALEDVIFLGRGEDQTLPALGLLLEDPAWQARAVRAVVWTIDRTAVSARASPAEVASLADRYRSTLRERGHLPK